MNVKFGSRVVLMKIQVLWSDWYVSIWKDVLLPLSDTGCPGIWNEPHTHYLTYLHCSELNQCSAVFQAKRHEDEGKKNVYFSTDVYKTHSFYNLYFLLHIYIYVCMYVCVCVCVWCYPKFPRICS